MDDPAADHQIVEIRDEIARAIERLDDLVFDTVARQLHGEDAKTLEKRLSRARNALRRAYALLDSTETDEFSAE